MGNHFKNINGELFLKYEGEILSKNKWGII